LSREKTTIRSLRDRYKDLVHSLSNLEIRVSGATVRAEFIDTERLGRKGAFRLHPRLPAIQIWPDMETAYKYIRSFTQTDEDIVKGIEHLRRVREAEEAVTRARSRGEPPSRRDWQIIQEARAQPMRLRPSIEEGSLGSVITLREIEHAVTVGRTDILQKHRALPREPVEVRLRPGAPTRLRLGVSIRLMVQFD
jgi:hypothetical protein